MSYQPRPGSGAAKVIEALQALADGETLTTSEVAERAGVDANTVSGLMVSAVNAGVVKTTRAPGVRTLRWCMGDGTSPEPDETDDDPPRQRIVPAASAPRLGWIPAHPLSPFGAPASMPEDEPGESAEVAPEPAARTPSRAIPLPVRTPIAGRVRFAMWSDGSLQVVADQDELFLFTPEDTLALQRYLKRWAAEEASA